MDNKDFEIEQIDFNAPHVVYWGADGKLWFSESSKGYHKGLMVQYRAKNFQDAQDYISRHNKHLKQAKAANDTNNEQISTTMD